MNTPNPDHDFDIVADYGPGDTTPGLPPPYMIPGLLARRKEIEAAGLPIPDDLPPPAEPPKPDANP